MNKYARHTCDLDDSQHFFCFIALQIYIERCYLFWDKQTYTVFLYWVMIAGKFFFLLLFICYLLVFHWSKRVQVYKIKSRDWSRSCCLKAVEPRFSVLFTTRTNTLPRDFLSQPLELTQAFPYASLVCYCWIWMGSTRSPHPRGYILVRQSF